jgi:hypothetical protein
MRESPHVARPHAALPVFRTFHARHLPTDAIKARQEYCWESRKLGAGQRMGARGASGLSLCVFHMLSRHNWKLVGGWRTMWQ